MTDKVKSNATSKTLMHSQKLPSKKKKIKFSGILQKRVTSGGAHLHDLAPGQHSSEETSQRWRAVGDTVSGLTDPRIEPQTFHTDSDVFNHHTNWPVNNCVYNFRKETHFEICQLKFQDKVWTTYIKFIAFREASIIFPSGYCSPDVLHPTSIHIDPMQSGECGPLKPRQVGE